MRRLIVVALLLLFARAAAAQRPADELAKAEDAILAKLSDRDRVYARALSAPAGIPQLYLRNPESLKKGAWGQPAADIPQGTEVIHTGDGPKRVPVVSEDDLRFHVDEVIDKNEVLVSDFRIWLEGIDASELADEDVISLAGIFFEVRGTRNYETVVGGKRTVKHLVAIDVGRAAAAALKLRTLREFRVWEDDSGKFSVLAKFVEFKGGKVTLEKLDGKQSKLPTSRLSKADQKYVRDALRERSAR